MTEKPSDSIGGSIDKWFAAIPGLDELQQSYAEQAHSLEIGERLQWLLENLDQEYLGELASEYADDFDDPEQVALAVFDAQLSTWTNEGSPQAIESLLSPPPQLIELPQGHVALMVFATRFSNIKSVLSQFEDDYDRVYGNPGITPRTLDLMAKVMKMMGAGMPNTDIAWALLEEEYPEIAALSDEERIQQYKPEHRRMLNRMSQLRNRDIETVTKLLDPLKRETD